MKDNILCITWFIPLCLVILWYFYIFISAVTSNYFLKEYNLYVFSIHILSIVVFIISVTNISKEWEL